MHQDFYDETSRDQTKHSDSAGTRCLHGELLCLEVRYPLTLILRVGGSKLGAPTIMHELCPLSEGQAAHSAPPAAQPSSDSSSLNTIDVTRRDDWIVESCKAEIMIDAKKNVLDTTRVLSMPLPHIPDQSSPCPTTQLELAKAGECSQGDGEWMIEPLLKTSRPSFKA